MKSLFEKLLGRANLPFRPRIDQYWHLPVDEMSNARLHDTLSPLIAINPALRSFEAAKELVWVDNSHPPVRPVIAFERMKGGELWPNYGLSVDFVPVIVGKRAIMRSGLKGVKLDVRIDSRDHRFGINFMWGSNAALNDMSLTLPIVLDRAVPFWLKHQTVATLADAVHFQEAHTTAISGLGVDNYIQAGFARPFLLAAAGEKEQACLFWKVHMERELLDETGKRKAQDQFDIILRETL